MRLHNVDFKFCTYNKLCLGDKIREDQKTEVSNTNGREEKFMHVQGVVWKPEGNLRGRWEIILKLSLNKQGEMVLARFTRLRIGASHLPCHVPELLSLKKIYQSKKSGHTSGCLKLRMSGFGDRPIHVKSAVNKVIIGQDSPRAL